MTTRYYDHEREYRAREARGQRGWDVGGIQSAHTFMAYFASPNFPRPGVSLDLGCGGGQLCAFLVSHGWKTVGVDYSMTALSMAQQNLSQAGITARLARVDLTSALPIRDATFDLVIDHHVLHCLVDDTHRAEFLRNAFNALCVGGVFFSTNMSCEGALDFEALEIDRETRVNKSYTRKWASRVELETEFDKVGLRIVSLTHWQNNDQPAAGDEIAICAVRR